MTAEITQSTITDYVRVVVNKVERLSPIVFGNEWPSHPHHAHTELDHDDHLQYMLCTAGALRPFTGDVYFQDAKIVGTTKVTFDDHYRASQAVWTYGGIDISRTAAEWSAFFAAFGEVSILAAFRALYDSTAEVSLEQYAIGYGGAGDVITGDAANFHYNYAIRQAHIGAGAPAYIGATPDSLYVAGQAEFTSSAYHVGAIWALSTLYVSTGMVVVYDDHTVRFGTGNDVLMGFYNVGTPNSFRIGLPTESRYFIICDKADIAHDWGHADEDDPSIIIQSADSTHIDQYVKFQHNQVDAVYMTEVGSHRWVDEYMTGGGWDVAAGCPLSNNPTDWSRMLALAGGTVTSLLDLIYRSPSLATLDSAYSAGKNVSVDNGVSAWTVPVDGTSSVFSFANLNPANTSEILNVYNESTVGAHGVYFDGDAGSTYALGSFPPAAPGHSISTAGDAITLLKSLVDPTYPSYAWLSLRRVYSEFEMYRSRASFGTANTAEAAQSEIYADTWYSSGAWNTQLHVGTDGFMDISAQTYLEIECYEDGYVSAACSDGLMLIFGTGLTVDADDSNAYAALSVDVGGYPNACLYAVNAYEETEAWLSFESGTSFHPELAVYGDVFTVFAETQLRHESLGFITSIAPHTEYRADKDATPAITFTGAHHAVSGEYLDAKGDVLRITHLTAALETPYSAAGADYYFADWGVGEVLMPPRSIMHYVINFITTFADGRYFGVYKIEGVVYNLTEAEAVPTGDEISNAVVSDLFTIYGAGHEIVEYFSNSLEIGVTLGAGCPAARHVMTFEATTSRLGYIGAGDE